jgi:fumarate reductase flavoprotein subunit
VKEFQTSPWEEIAPPVDTETSPERAASVVADVVILGAGAAGLPAAVTAMEAGAQSVIVVEQRPTLGGNAARAEGIFACESQAQRRAFVRASADDIFTKVMNWHHYSRVEPRILHAYLRRSGETVDWLEKKGVVFTLGTTTRLRFDQNATWHIPEGHCAAIVRALAKECTRLGVQILTRTSAKDLLMGAAGRVRGVLVERDNVQFEIKAKTIIIATGGFAGDKALLKKYFPYYTDGFFVPGLPLAGDGIRLAEQAGAALEDYACMLKETGFGRSPLTFSLLREPYLLCVNVKGKRFLAEDSIGFYPMECGNVIIRQPGMVYYALFDHQIGETIEREGFLLGRPGVHRGDPGVPVPGLREELNAPMYRGWATVAGSWAEIAASIGADAHTLAATIEEYNAFCDRGYDAEFVKDRAFLLPLRTAPYYAIKVQPMITDTIGPVKINEHMEVLDKKEEPIPGLYAAGVITSGWQSDEYCSEICGSAMGFSLNSGRMAAESAVRFAKNNG